MGGHPEEPEVGSARAFRQARKLARQADHRRHASGVVAGAAEERIEMAHDAGGVVRVARQEAHDVPALRAARRVVSDGGGNRGLPAAAVAAPSTASIEKHGMGRSPPG